MSKIIKQGKNEYQSWSLPTVQGVHVINREIDENYSISDNLREQVKQQKYNENFAKGYTDGLQAAENKLAEKKNELANSISYMHQLIYSLNEPFNKLDQQVEQELVALAAAIAKKIIHREIKLDPGQIMAVVNEALEVLPAASRDVKIALHPEDAKIVLEMSSAPGGTRQWTVEEDPSLTRGGCQVTTNTSQIDASVESRLAVIISQILDGKREQNHTTT
jgi:flagellar assembly protein FliH